MNMLDWFTKLRQQEGILTESKGREKDLKHSHVVDTKEGVVLWDSKEQSGIDPDKRLHHKERLKIGILFEEDPKSTTHVK